MCMRPHTCRWRVPNASSQASMNFSCNCLWIESSVCRLFILALVSFSRRRNIVHWTPFPALCTHKSIFYGSHAIKYIVCIIGWFVVHTQIIGQMLTTRGCSTSSNKYTGGTAGIQPPAVRSFWTGRGETASTNLACSHKGIRRASCKGV